MNNQSPKQKIFFPISRYSRLCTVYGFFAVLCQSVMILLCVICEDANVSREVLRHTYLPYLEYPLMSLTLIIGGALLLDWAILRA